MSRSTAEWIGKTDDTPIPDHVRVRVFDRYGGHCYLCTRKILAGEYWECDHVIAIINGGPNRESNLKPACCNCCRPKTAKDVAEKSAVYQKRVKHIVRRKSSFAGSRDSKWKKCMDGRVVRRSTTQEV